MRPNADIAATDCAQAMRKEEEYLKGTSQYPSSFVSSIPSLNMEVLKTEMLAADSTAAKGKSASSLPELSNVVPLCNSFAVWRDARYMVMGPVRWKLLARRNRMRGFSDVAITASIDGVS